ncbi:cell wall-binding repeat-containing protein [Romboutsia sp. 1001713B170131_170501_G6]|uniref:cell wall-binding repeat-containing protein n=1 Tax=Romboutsia sp. 1001713B170131_170501_G6 TaxID=2787108 RepID=UPI0018ABBF13|nr:cell wall-binding repeat-containing protein [Romboutsia sp. 1001713B170131_170501_G6]
MKKRNMAITIAAVSAATSVAPALAFADTLDNQVIASTDAKAVAQLKGEIQGFLNTKYTDDEDLMATGAQYQYNGAKEAAKAGQCVYTINLTEANGTKEAITTMEQLDVALAKLNDTTNKFLNIEVIDNGHKTVNGQIVNWKEGTYTQDDINNLYTELTKAQSTPAGNKQAQAGETTQDKKETTPVVSKLAADAPKAIEDVTRVDANTLSLELKNNDKPLVIKTGDTKLNLNDPIYSQDKMGSYLDKDGKVISGVTDATAATNADTVVTGFEVEREALEQAQNGQPSDFEATRNYGVDYEAAKTTNFKATDLYDFNIGRFTIEGNQLEKFIAEYNTTKVNGQIEKATNTLDTTNGTLTITLPVDKTDEMDETMPNIASITADHTSANGAYAKIVISGSSKNLTDLQNMINPEGQKTNPQITTLAGMDRYDTAVQVSKATFATEKTANNVVLVSGNSLADGLAATPFARQQNAPILLTGKDKVSDKTMDEITRVMKAGGNVYVIGGENTISKSVETQLQAKGIAKANVIRIKGNDRYETSLAIAQKMGAKQDEMFIAGGYAQADAMSIAGVAAKGGATQNTANPILLVDAKNGLSADQLEYMENAGLTKTYITGGANSVSTKLEDQIKASDAKGTVQRLAGDDRQDTNAAVVKEFYKNGFNEFYVAKSDNQGLVDSLSAGALAGKENAPVVLATNAVNASQQSVIKALSKEDATKTQIGYGIAAQVWSTISDLFTK